MKTIISDSSIVNATVYRKGAFVTRRANVLLKEGKNTVEIEKLSRSIDSDSIQIGVDEKVVCQQVSYDSMKNGHRIDESADFTVTEIDERIRSIKNKIEILDLRIEVIRKMDVKYDISKGIEAIDVFNNYNCEQITVLINEQSELNLELNTLEKKKEEEKNQQTESVWKRLPATIFIELMSDTEHEAEIEIQYYDRLAEWYPHYDIRLEDSKENIEFILKGNISQNTGEDWDNIPMCVSTGNYSQKRYKGELAEWRIGTQHIEHRSGSLQMVSSQMEYEDDYDDCEEDGIKKINIPDFLKKAPSSDAAAPKYACRMPESDIIDNQNSIMYTLPENCSVSNGKGSDTVFINSMEIKCDIADFTIPKLDCSAFMVAKISDFSKYNFIKCGANVFFNNRFVGKTKINPEEVDNSMLVSLGPDHKVDIKRITEKQLSSKSFIGATRTMEYEFVIKINNRKKIPVSLNVTDQIPVSDDAKITVEVINLSKGTLDDKTGKVTWTVDLPPEEEKELRLAFKIVTRK